MATGTQLEKNPQAMPGQAQLTDRLAGIWTRARVRWAAMLPAQRGWAIAVAVLLVALIAGVSWYALRTDWKTLYADMEPEDARQTGLILSQALIPFQPTPNGAGIMVAAPNLDKARLVTAAKGSFKSGRLGFELFDKPNWVGSEFDEQVNYQRALEGELEHTVGTLSDVESARVHLVMPHDSLFREQDRPAKASVVLKLRHKNLADGEPDAIRNLVASAVDGLSSDRVVLVDAAGHQPLGPKTAEAMRLSEEQIKEQKLVEMLEPVVGAGNVRASVTLDYDSAATEETVESFDPNQSVTKSMQRSEQTAGAQPIAAGVPGSATNAPNSTSLPVYPTQSSSPQTAKTETATYDTSKTTRHSVENPGRVRRLTAAIMVNDHLVQSATKGKVAQWKAWTPEELSNMTATAQAAVGFDSTRGDTLTVKDLAFDENRPPQPLTIGGQIMDLMQKQPELVKYSSLLLGLMVVLAFGVRPALKRARAVPIPRAVKELEGQAAVPQPILAPPEPVELDPERIRANEIFEAVTDHLKREPTQSSRLLQSWIHTE